MKGTFKITNGTKVCIRGEYTDILKEKFETITGIAPCVAVDSEKSTPFEGFQEITD